MWRFLLAFKCFFLILFARRLPSEAAALLPPPEPPPKPLPEARAAAVPVPVVPDAPAVPERRPDEGRAEGAILLLGVLQREGRLLDFLDENIDGYPDDRIGAAVRDIHRGCRKALAEHLTLEPVLRQPESATVKVETGFDPSRIRLVGNVVGTPPFMGTLRHPGWRGLSVKLPELSGAGDPSVIAPAEVEL